MKLTFKITVLSAGLMLAANANAAVPNTFSAGEPARAAEVNANFADVDQKALTNASDIQTNASEILTNAGNIQANANAIATTPAQTVYDYRDFLADPSISSKTFATTGLCGDSEVRTITRTPNGANTDVTVTRRRLSSGVTCQLNDFNYVNTPSQRLLVSGGNFMAVDDSLVSTKIPVDPIVVATSTMPEGGTIANGTRINSTPAGGSPAYLGTLVDARVAVELEDVSVPAGNFTGCLKISLIRQSAGFGAFQRVAWTCPGVGEVKRIQLDRMWELTSTVTAVP